jgi:hypothetical protein
MAEVAFGFAFAHQLAVKILGNFNLLGLLGAMSTIYVIARGFNNIAGFNSSRILESGLTARSCRTADASTEISPRS